MENASLHNPLLALQAGVEILNTFLKAENAKVARAQRRKGKKNSCFFKICSPSFYGHSFSLIRGKKPKIVLGSCPSLSAPRWIKNTF